MFKLPLLTALQSISRAESKGLSFAATAGSDKSINPKLDARSEIRAMAKNGSDRDMKTFTTFRLPRIAQSLCCNAIWTTI